MARLNAVVPCHPHPLQNLATSAEQTAGIDQVNQAVTSMDEVTQQNAALAEQTSAASASMSEKSRELNEMVARFQL